MNERTGLYAIIARHHFEGTVEVHLNSRGRPWTTISGAERILKQLQEQRGTCWQLSVVPAVES